MCNSTSAEAPAASSVPVVCWLVTEGGQEGTTTNELVAALADSAEPLVRLSDHLSALAAASK